MPTDFPHKYGLAVDSELDEKINRHLQEGDSRSARIRRLVRLGIIFEDEMLDEEYWPPDPEVREDILRTAIRSYLEDELD